MRVLTNEEFTSARWRELIARVQTAIYALNEEFMNEFDVTGTEFIGDSFSGETSFVDNWDPQDGESDLAFKYRLKVLVSVPAALLEKIEGLPHYPGDIDQLDMVGSSSEANDVDALIPDLVRLMMWAYSRHRPHQTGGVGLLLDRPAPQSESEAKNERQ